MIKNFSTIISGILAFGIYFALIGVMIFYFNTREQKKPVHYVKKSEDRIRVTMSAPKPAPKKEVKKTPKKVEKAKPKPKPKPKKTEKKREEKKVIKEKVVKKAKVVKKKKDVNTTKPKKVNKPKDLFANVTSTKKPSKPKPKIEKKPQEPKKSIKVPEKVSATELVSNTLKSQKKSDVGIENAYLAMIEEKLKGWPAQSDYAGEKARVVIQVEPSGLFRYKVISASGNEEFNSGLISYLKQLQKIGFGPHQGNRPYELDVEFIAKE